MGKGDKSEKKTVLQLLPQRPPRIWVYINLYIVIFQNMIQTFHYYQARLSEIVIGSGSFDPELISV